MILVTLRTASGNPLRSGEAEDLPSALRLIASYLLIPARPGEELTLETSGEGSPLRAIRREGRWTLTGP